MRDFGGLFHRCDRGAGAPSSRSLISHHHAPICPVTFPIRQNEPTDARRDAPKRRDSARNGTRTNRNHKTKPPRGLLPIQMRRDAPKRRGSARNGTLQHRNVKTNPPLTGEVAFNIDAGNVRPSDFRECVGMIAGRVDGATARISAFRAAPSALGRARGLDGREENPSVVADDVVLAQADRAGDTREEDESIGQKEAANREREKRYVRKNPCCEQRSDCVSRQIPATRPHRAQFISLS